MIATEPCNTGMVSSVFSVLALILCDSISSFCSWFGGSSVPTYAFEPSNACPLMPHASIPAPLPTDVYVTVGTPLEPCVPLQALAFAEVLKSGPQTLTWASFCSDEPLPLMLEPEHCSPIVPALAAPGATRAATAAAEMMHAGTARRAESNVIIRLPPG